MDGVIIAGKVTDKLIDYIDALGLPIVLVDYESKKRLHSAVLIDNRTGARTAVLHLLDRGHRSVAFIAGDIRHPSIAERFGGFQDALHERNILPEQSLIVHDQPSLRSIDGEEAMAKILKQDKHPTAVFAANDAMAIGCARFLRDRGMKIPDDIAVVGFDDIEMSSHVEPPLTTVRVFKEEMGKLAVLRLVEMIKSKTRTLITTHVPVELIVRESTVGNSTKHP